MTTALTSRSLVEKYYELIDNGHVDDAMELTTEDIKFKFANAAPAVGRSATRAGIDRVLDQSAAASAVAEGLRIPLRTVTIGENGEYTDPDGAWARLSQLDRGGAVLVRPDHHVAYRSTSPVPDAENALLRALSAVLARLPEPVG